VIDLLLAHGAKLAVGGMEHLILVHRPGAGLTIMSGACERSSDRIQHGISFSERYEVYYISSRVEPLPVISKPKQMLV